MDSSDSKKMVSITQTEFDRLTMAWRKLIELESAGVDNWEGYEEIDWDYIDTGKRNDES